MQSVLLAVLLSAGSGTSVKTVGIVPLTTTSTEEYQWVGGALAQALNMRIALQPELGSVTVRQLNAAMRGDGIEADSISKPEVATKLGRLVGADILLTGSYEARWPDIRLQIRVHDIRAGKIKSTYDIPGELDRLVMLEADVARRLAKDMGADVPDVSEGAFGTTNLRAWRLVALAQNTLDWQSLSPNAADAHNPLVLPEAAIKSARTQAQEACSLDPDYGEAFATLGLTQALLGETKEAWKSFGKATALGFGHHPTAVLGASFLRMRENRIDDAASILISALHLRPGFLQARGYLGELYLQAKRYKEAQETFDAYLAAVPKQPWALTQRGYAKSKQGDINGSIADSIAAVDCVPDSPSLLIQLASRYIDAKKLVGAEDALLQALKIQPGETRAYVRLGYVYLLQGRDDMAIPVSEKALVQSQQGSTAKDRAYAHLNLVQAYGRKGNTEQALAHLKQARAETAISLEALEGDPALKALRADARYQALAK